MGKAKNITKDQKEKVREMFAKGYSGEAICKKLNVSLCTFYKYRRYSLLDEVTMRERSSRDSEITERILKYYDEGVKPTEIVSLGFCGHSTVYNALKTYSRKYIEVREEKRRKNRRRRGECTKDDAYDSSNESDSGKKHKSTMKAMEIIEKVLKYYDKGVKPSEIASLGFCGHSTVYNALKKHSKKYNELREEKRKRRQHLNPKKEEMTIWKLEPEENSDSSNWSRSSSPTSLCFVKVDSEQDFYENDISLLRDPLEK